MKTNILLITPLNIPFKEISWDATTKRKLDPKYPVGLLCIGSYIKDNCSDVNVEIVDYNTEAPRYFSAEGWPDFRSLEGLLEYGLKDLSWIPDIIGISALFSSNYFDMGAIVKHLDHRYPQALIVTGGHLASACYKKFLAYPGLDAVGYGECEIPFAGLVIAHQKKKAKEYLSLSPMWITKEKIISDDKFVPEGVYIQNLDNIPPYDLSMLKYPDDYLNTNDDLFGLGVESAGKDIAMFATRGCPYHCLFCASQFVHGHVVRKYSVDRIKRDILYYNSKYGITSFPFLDDHFLADKEAAIEILNFIHDHGFTSRIFNLNYIHTDREIIKALKKTGSDRILITIDGLNEEFLRKVVRKPANFAKAKEVINICREEGIMVLANIVVGFPGETMKSIDEGMLDMLDMGANWYSVLTATPLHGSKLYEICKEKGYLPERDEIFTIDYNHTVITTPDFTPDEIQSKAYEVNLYLNFVYNYDMLIMDEYEAPLRLFERVMKIVPDHSFAYYFAAKCALALKYHGKSEYYNLRYHETKKIYPWNMWVNHFSLEEL